METAKDWEADVAGSVRARPQAERSELNRNLSPGRVAAHPAVPEVSSRVNQCEGVATTSTAFCSGNLINNKSCIFVSPSLSSFP